MSNCKGHTDEEKGYYVCSLCECNLGVHAFYFHCPLLDNEIICSDCCQNDVEKEEIIKIFKALGKEHAREEIETVCKGCGNRSCGIRPPGDAI